MESSVLIVIILLWAVFYKRMVPLAVETQEQASATTTVSIAAALEHAPHSLPPSEYEESTRKPTSTTTRT